MYVRRKGMAWSSLGLPDGFFTNQKKIWANFGGP
jgi:hypothetical protein